MLIYYQKVLPIDGYVDYITFHHNWFDHSDSRCPRIRNGKNFHIYNNYYDGVSKYGVGVTCASSAFVESNYFRNTKYPMLISGQGSDKYNASTGEYTATGTFSGEDGGIIKAYNNEFSDTVKRLVYQNVDKDNSNGATDAKNPTEFGAYLVTDKTTTISSDVAATQTPDSTQIPEAAIATPDILKDAKGNVYKVLTKNKTVSLVKPYSTKIKTYTIKKTVKLNGKKYKVTAISANAFRKCTKLKKLTIEKNVTAIGKNAFYHCKKLNNITIKSLKLKNKSIKTKAFKKIQAKAVIKVPKKKYKLYKKILKKAGVGKKVKIKKI